MCIERSRRRASFGGFGVDLVALVLPGVVASRFLGSGGSGIGLGEVCTRGKGKEGGNCRGALNGRFVRAVTDATVTDAPVAFCDGGSCRKGSSESGRGRR